jgi:hypothetical protein
MDPFTPLPEMQGIIKQIIKGDGLVVVILQTDGIGQVTNAEPRVDDIVRIQTLSRAVPDYLTFTQEDHGV